MDILNLNILQHKLRNAFVVFVMLIGGELIPVIIKYVKYERYLQFHNKYHSVDKAQCKYDLNQILMMVLINKSVLIILIIIDRLRLQSFDDDLLTTYYIFSV